MIRLEKYYSNIHLRYTVSFFFGLTLSIILNDIPLFAAPLEAVLMNSGYQVMLSKLTVLHLNIFGVPAFLSNNQIVVGERSFYFAYGCLGIRHLTLFAGFILVYFGQFYQKLKFIVMGFFILTLANISRATIIGIAIRINPSWFDLAHEYGSMLILYTTIFLLWIIWSKKTKGL